MVEGNIWDNSLNDLSATDLARVSSYTEISQKLRTFADNQLKGIYHCARCGTALYSSEQKFTPLEPGVDEWPTFRAPIDPKSIQVQHTFSFGLENTHIHCGICGLFLGDLYLDGKECGDSNENAKERHSLHSFTLHFVKDKSEEREFKEPKAPKELVELLLQEHILLPAVAEEKPKPNPIPEQKKNKDEEVIKMLEVLDDTAKPAPSKPAPSSSSSSPSSANPPVAPASSHLVRNLVIGGVVVAAAAGAAYYFISKKNDHPHQGSSRSFRY